MIKTFEIAVSTQYLGHYGNMYIEARTAKEAVSQLRKIVKREMWFDSRNDGKITYKVI